MALNIKQHSIGIAMGVISGDLLKEEIRKALGTAPAEDLKQCKAVLDGVTYGIDHSRKVVVTDSPDITHLAHAADSNSRIAELDQLDGNVTAYNVPPEWRKELT